jgi:PEP-CTERM motif
MFRPLQTCFPRHRPGLLARGLAVTALSMVSALAHAASVSYQATNLADLVPGQDLWQLDYTVQGPFEAFASINLLFEADRYAALQVAGMVPPGSLDTLLSPADVQLGVDGQLILSALKPLPDAFTSQVSVRLVWLGQGSPGSQRFEWLGPDFDIQASGLIPLTSPVPEPTSLALAMTGAGLGLAWGARARRRPSDTPA